MAAMPDRRPLLTAPELQTREANYHPRFKAFPQDYPAPEYQAGLRASESVRVPIRGAWFYHLKFPVRNSHS
jgi:hypothetical protein